MFDPDSIDYLSHYPYDMMENTLVDGIVMVNPDGITRLLKAAPFVLADCVTLPNRLFGVVSIPASTNPAVAKLPPVMVPVVDITFEPNAAKNVAT